MYVQPQGLQKNFLVGKGNGISGKTCIYEGIDFCGFIPAFIAKGFVCGQ